MFDPQTIDTLVFFDMLLITDAENTRFEPGQALL